MDECRDTEHRVTYWLEQEVEHRWNPSGNHRRETNWEEQVERLIDRTGGLEDWRVEHTTVGGFVKLFNWRRRCEIFKFVSSKWHKHHHQMVGVVLLKKTWYCTTWPAGGPVNLMVFFSNILGFIYLYILIFNISLFLFLMHNFSRYYGTQSDLPKHWKRLYFLGFSAVCLWPDLSG